MSGNIFDTETFLDDPATLQMLEQLGHSSMPVGNLALGPLVSAERLVGMITSGNWSGDGRYAASGPGTPSPDVPDLARYVSPCGVVSQLRRRLRLLDLIASLVIEGLGLGPCETGTGSAFKNSVRS